MILVTLAHPALKFSDFDALYEKYTSDNDIQIEEKAAAFSADEIVKNEFEQKICTVIKDDIGKNLTEKCDISAIYDGKNSAKIYISCKDGDFDKISGYISQKYGLQCAKNEKTGY